MPKYILSYVLDYIRQKIVCRLILLNVHKAQVPFEISVSIEANINKKKYIFVNKLMTSIKNKEVLRIDQHSFIR